MASFTENKGQWPQHVLYRVLLPDGALFIEREAFTYVLQRGGGAHTHGTAQHVHDAEPYRAHAFRVRFSGGSAQAWGGATKAAHYENFFLGNDPARWGTGCGVFGEVTLRDVWPGIDLHVDGRAGLKYEFVVAAGADPATIRLAYEGQDGVALRDGRCVVRTTAGELIEEAPLSYYADDAAREPIPTWFKLHGSELSFALPAGLDATRPLVIDPVLSFASYSGSLADNFGFTATYDGAGHLYGGGIVFGVGYPTTTGVLDASFNGGSIDVGISKWTPDGSGLVWSTYIGGTGNEAPHSMVVNDADELFVFGHTGSANFPTTPGCYDNTFGGGGPLEFTIGYGYDQPAGTDMFVAHLNAAATAMIGSTFVGGAGNDGLNNREPLAHNYGDSFRGEIIVDANGDPVIASTTESTGLPVIGGPQTAYGGGAQDGYCFRMDPLLTTMLWSTYIGGSGVDAAFGVQVDSGGELFVTGGTTSSNLPMAGTPFQGTSSGGADGFIMRYAAGTLAGSTYIGTSSYDQSYFVQLNTADEVFVVGQTHGDHPITPGKYAVPGSSQFIYKLDHSLSTSLWSTCFGNGSRDQYLSPTAFLVSDCGQIYFSGWGGSTNRFAGNSMSTTTGSQVTPDAFQPSTDGDDLYLMVLEPEATALNYATFFGGSTSSEHVDGGTSRFDKNGNVYQAVCAGCQGQNDFPTTPGAWSRVNGSSNCNIGVMKFDLLATVAIIGIDGPAEVCPATEVRFTNTSRGGDTYAWDFGDGNTSTAAAPTHTYSEPGTYTVAMHLSDGTGCARPDSAELVVTVIVDPPVTVPPVGPVCPGSTVQVTIPAGVAWSWSPTTGVSDPTAAAPLITPRATTTYEVLVTGRCEQTTVAVPITVLDPVGSAGPDRSICAGDAVMLDGSGGGTYLWEPPTSLSDATVEDPMASPADSTVYVVAITTPEGCMVRDTVVVAVDDGLPTPQLADTLVCEGSTVTLNAPAGREHLWLAGQEVAEPTARTQSFIPLTAMWYVVRIANACGAITDSAFVDIRVPVVRAEPDTIVCPGQPVQLTSTAGTVHAWSPSAGLSDPASPSPIATVHAPVTYIVRMTDDIGCTAQDSVVLAVHPMHPVTALWDQVIDLGETAQLLALGDGTFAWAPAATLSDSTSASPIAKPQRATTYTVYMTDLNGCITTDEVIIIVPGSLFIPNTFSPNGDGYNDLFGAWGVDIVQLRLDVFDRWGKLIWSAPDLAARWDGRYGGQDAPIDTYVWKVHATDITGEVYERVGHVTLVR